MAGRFAAAADREMAAHYRQLLVEHLDYQAQREIAD
jgi:hypothetical protein